MSDSPAGGDLEPRSVVNARGRRLFVCEGDVRGERLVQAHGDLNGGSLRLWRMLAEGRPWDLVVDVGANYGEMVLGANYTGSPRMVAFEPSSEIAEMLRKSVAESGLGVEVVEAAVSDRAGDVTLFRDLRWSGKSTLVAPNGSSVLSEQQSRAVTLGEYFSDQDASSALIKVDVEGHEFAVLAGAVDLVESTPDIVFMIEVLHLSDSEIASLSSDWQIFALDTRFGRLVRVHGTVRGVSATVRGGWCYPQDVVIVPQGRALPWSMRSGKEG